MKTLLSIFILVQLTFLHADNYSLSFDGSNDYVSISNSDNFDIVDELTITAWVQPSQIKEASIIDRLVDSGNEDTGEGGYRLNIRSNGEIWATFGTSCCNDIANTSTNFYDTNEWVHIAGVFKDANYVKLYINGNLIESTNTSRIFNTNNTLEFGRGNWGANDEYFNGNMDEVTIWSVELTESQIQSYMTTSPSGSETGLVGYWNFNEGTGTTLADQTSNEHNGTISGATWSTDVPPTSGGNNALSFDGDDDYVSVNGTVIDNVFSGTQAFTIALWVYGDGGGNDGISKSIINKGNTFSSNENPSTFMLLKQQVGTITCILFTDANNWIGAGMPDGTLNSDTWNHIVVTYNGGNTHESLSFYVNSTSVSPIEGTDWGNYTGMDYNTDSFNFGARKYQENSTFYFWDSKIDETAIWNDALTAAEVTALYNSGTSLIPSSNSGNYSSSSNLQAYWNFNEGTGTTLADQTSNDNDGTISGASWTGDGAPVTAATTPTNTYSLSFDGTDDYVEITNQSSATSVFGYAFTSTAWVKVTGGSGTNRNILTNAQMSGDGYVLQVTNENQFSGIIDLQSGWSTVWGSTDVGLNTWYHFAFSYDGSSLKLYVNGELDGENSNVSGEIIDPVGNSSFFIGTRQDLAALFFPGIIDEITIWNTTLTQEEIQSHMSTELNGNETGLVGYWKFNEGTGTTASDATSNDNDGTINGATWSTDVPFTGATTTSALTWSVRAKASLSTYNDNDNYLGVASNATNVFDASYDALEPPAAPGSSISLYFPHAEWDYLLGDNFSTDARPVVALTDTMQVWDFVVKSTDAGEATLTFVYASVPSVPVILENTATGARQTLSNNATYTFTAVADSAHPFRVSIGDTTAPTLTLGASCSGPAILISDSTHSLSWTSTDGFEVDSVLVSFSSDSGTTYSLQASLGTASGYNWTVPDAMVMTGGKLKLKAQDYAGNSKEEVSSYVFAIAGDSLSSAVTAGWTLWGAPINPTNDTMTTNLADDFSGYWDTFDYVDNGYTYNGILKEAEGYWLGADQNATVDVKGTPVDSNFTMSLSQGWELISNPLVLDVNVDSLTFRKNDTTKTHAEAVTAGWVNSIYSYSSSGYVSATTFSPWSGYWMAVLETGVEMTYPIHRNSGSRSARSIENEWMISFDAQVDGGNDGITRIGYAETATDGFDTEHDAVKPPNPPGPEYVSLFIAHPEWNYPLGDKFAKDIRAAVPANGYQEWQLTMESSESDAQLSWTLVNIPDDYEVGYSIDGGQYFDDMRDVSTITISANTEIIVRVGSQVLGIGDEPIPTVFALHQNYPNPFNPVTTLRYDLPENGIITIIIYDMLGRQVKTLINQTQDAGFKSVVWNATNDYGKPVSAGIYLYQIQAGEYISTKKMVLLK